MTLADLQAIVARVRFLDRRFLVLTKGDGFLVQMAYDEADVDTGEPAEQKTRKWYVSPHATETEVVETCWAMVQRSQLHVAGEHFTYEGFRVYSPHLHVGARVEACMLGCFDARETL